MRAWGQRYYQKTDSGSSKNYEPVKYWQSQVLSDGRSNHQNQAQSGSYYLVLPRNQEGEYG